MIWLLAIIVLVVVLLVLARAAGGRKTALVWGLVVLSFLGAGLSALMFLVILMRHTGPDCGHAPETAVQAGMVALTVTAMFAAWRTLRSLPAVETAERGAVVLMGVSVLATLVLLAAGIAAPADPDRCNDLPPSPGASSSSQPA